MSNCSYSERHEISGGSVLGKFRNNYYIYVIFYVLHKRDFLSLFFHLSTRFIGLNLYANARSTKRY